eukprot:2751461-Alexandrium_andersonii.AAC.1
MLRSATSKDRREMPTTFAAGIIITRALCSRAVQNESPRSFGEVLVATPPRSANNERRRMAPAIFPLTKAKLGFA